MRGLEALDRGRARMAERRANVAPRLLVDEDETGRTFRAGDVVRDSVTGVQGRAERVETRRVIIPPARR